MDGGMYLPVEGAPSAGGVAILDTRSKIKPKRKREEN